MHDAALMVLIMRKISRNLRTQRILKPLENVMMVQKFIDLFRFSSHGPHNAENFPEFADAKDTKTTRECDDASEVH